MCRIRQGREFERNFQEFMSQEFTETPPYMAFYRGPNAGLTSRRMSFSQGSSDCGVFNVNRPAKASWECAAAIFLNWRYACSREGLRTNLKVCDLEGLSQREDLRFHPHRKPPARMSCVRARATDYLAHVRTPRRAAQRRLQLTGVTHMSTGLILIPFTIFSYKRAPLDVLTLLCSCLVGLVVPTLVGFCLYQCSDALDK
ncbi:hypothetical protein J6590_015757 [Homalodisca vitripennis]|nr:hypothetical protein J6590_015757 [Homalodisca vitripennis]